MKRERKEKEQDLAGSGATDLSAGFVVGTRSYLLPISFISKDPLTSR